MSLKLEIVFQWPSLQDQLAFCFLTSLYGYGPSPTKAGRWGLAVLQEGLSSLNHQTCNQADVFRARACINDFRH